LVVVLAAFLTTAVIHAIENKAPENQKPQTEVTTSVPGTAIQESAKHHTQKARQRVRPSMPAVNARDTNLVKNTLLASKRDL